MSPSQSDTKTYLLGVDTGGTFTDFVLWNGHKMRVHKVLSTPQAPEQAIVQGLSDLGLETTPLRLRHGSTVATNALLEGKGVRTAYVANRGLADVLTIGRQQREHLYQLSPQPVAPPVPPELCLETGGRLAADGNVVEPLDDDDIDQLVKQIKQLAPEAVAINLLFSYLDDSFERRLETALAPHAFVARSSAVLAESGEYERGIATWLNAYIGPLMAHYLKRLKERAPQAKIAVMQSSGLTVSADQAAEHSVHLLLSGPAGGLAGAKAMGLLAGYQQLMTLDVGGTSTDVALIDSDIGLTREGRIGRYPVAVPMVDMHTIGAGGGSIVRIDGQGMLLVGPESAGAQPGPACYGQGGQHATVTDAHVLLGHIPVDAVLGPRTQLDLAAAKAALAPIATAMRSSVKDAAEGVLRLANEHIAAALRLISIERGFDPQAFTLCCFGGGGGLHACAAADLLAMRQVLIPAHAGVLSALGMLYSPAGRERTHALLGLLEGSDITDIEQGFEQLQQQLLQELDDEGVASKHCRCQRQVDLRYAGQSFTLTLDWQGHVATTEAFHQLHRQRYGHRLAHPVELVNLRLRVQAPAPAINLPEQLDCADEAMDDSSTISRNQIKPGQIVQGPRCIIDAVGTAWIEPGWSGQVDTYGNLVLNKA